MSTFPLLLLRIFQPLVVLFTAKKVRDKKVNQRSGETEMQRGVQYFPPNTCWHSGWLIHKSYKVILLKCTIASGKRTACLEAAPHGSRSNDYSLYNIANRVETQMQCQDAIASRVISLYVYSASDTKTLDLYKPLKFYYGFWCCIIGEKHLLSSPEPSFTLHRILKPTRAYLDSKVNTLIGFFFFIQKGLDSIPCRLSVHPSERGH